MNSNILNKKIKNLTFSVFLKFGSISFLIILLVGLTKCESSPEEKLNNDPLLKQDNSLPTLGGVIRIAENDCYNTLFPAEIEETVSFKVITQMHDGLVALNPKTLSVVPAIAKKWEVNDAQTTYTFQLHDNAYFHDDPCFSDGKGKKITSNDFLYTFNLLCGNLSSTGYNALNEKILGAADFHSGKTETISGIKIVNDSVFSIELIEPASSFVHLLASPLGSVISKDAFEAYGKELKVGAGPFIYGELNNDSSNLKLYKNNNYYQKDQFGNNLPYLDEISFTFESNEERREELFSTRKLDLLQGVSEIYLEKFFVENQKSIYLQEQLFNNSL